MFSDFNFTFSYLFQYPVFLLVSVACIQYPGFGSSCYKLYMSSRDWNTAKENCREVGGELVKIESEEENQFIKTEYLSARGRYWIGLSDLDYNGQWEW